MANFQQHMNIQKVAPNQYSLSYHEDWSVGITIFGGCIAALFHHTAATHVVEDPTLKALNQPDIMTMHVEYFRPTLLQESIITVTTIKTGKIASNLQLQLHQDDQLKAMALVTTTNFDVTLGPSVPSPMNLSPIPFPKPDFERILAGKPDKHWLPSYHAGDLTLVTGRILALRPRQDYPVDGFCDGWNTFRENEKMDATYLAFMGDFIPSMAHTLLGTGSTEDAISYTKKVREWSESHPGVPAVMTYSLADSMNQKTLDSMIIMSYEFKRRLPKEGVDWTYTRMNTNMLEKGRMDANVSIFNKDLVLLCTCKHVILVLDSSRKFGGSKPKASL